MKKLLIAVAFCTVCAGAYSQDSTRKKIEAKTEQTAKKVKKKAKKVSKDLDNKTDAKVKKTYPGAHKVKEN